MRAISGWCVLTGITLAACGGRFSIDADAPLGNTGASGGAGPTWVGATAGAPAQYAGRDGAGGGGTGTVSAGGSLWGGGGTGTVSAGGSLWGHGGQTGKAGSSASAGMATAGAAGNSPTDDPGTRGNEVPGKVECWGSFFGSKQLMTVCDAPQQCCAKTGKCLLSSDDCSFGRQSCDGDEDCAGGMHCCRGDDGATFSCEKACAMGNIRHLSCNGKCADFDRDGIPDDVDICPTSEREDGRGHGVGTRSVAGSGSR